MRIDNGREAPENTPQPPVRAGHAHEQRFWHAHRHEHTRDTL
ncbi:hypothetical protein LCGC14_1657140, partial [marine sediment metagenome]